MFTLRILNFITPLLLQLVIFARGMLKGGSQIKRNIFLWISIANFSAIVKQLVIHKSHYVELARDVVPAHRIMTVLTPSAREAYNVTFTC